MYAIRSYYEDGEHGAEAVLQLEPYRGVREDRERGEQAELPGARRQVLGEARAYVIGLDDDYLAGAEGGLERGAYPARRLLA